MSQALQALRDGVADGRESAAVLAAVEELTAAVADATATDEAPQQAPEGE